MSNRFCLLLQRVVVVVMVETVVVFLVNMFVTILRKNFWKCVNMLNNMYDQL